MKYCIALCFVCIVNLIYGQHYDFLGTDYTKPDSIALTYNFEGNLDPIKIAQDLTTNLNTDLEKYRVIFRWISENIKYDIPLYLKTVSHDYDPKILPKRSARWKKRLNKLYTKHTIKRRTTICEGYAWLLETMCLSAGIQCESIPGYARTTEHAVGKPFKPNHAWNVVKLNDKWYLSDPTWAAGHVNESFTQYFKEFTEAYFLVDPETFIANHYPVDKSWILLLNKPTLQDFFRSPIRPVGFIKNRISNFQPSMGQVTIQKDSALLFSLTMNNKLNAIAAESITLRNREYVSETSLPRWTQNKEGFYIFNTSFEQKGKYDLRIFINGSLSFVFEVFVK